MLFYKGAGGGLKTENYYVGKNISDTMAKALFQIYDSEKNMRGAYLPKDLFKQNQNL